MERTPLYDVHISLGARMVEFAGYSMPVLYTSIIDEHITTRNTATLFDVSHMGEIRITGNGSRNLIEKLVPTSLDRLLPGFSIYTVMCNPKGGVIDDLFVYMMEENDYLLVVNASTRHKDFLWIKNNQTTDDVEIRDESDHYFKIDIQGPKSGEILHTVFPTVLELERFHFINTEYKGLPLIISQSGYTGEYGFEIYGPVNGAPCLWNQLLENGDHLGIKPAGLGARDTLRLESCYSLYGHELTDEISPVEAGLGWLVSSSTEYCGKDTLVLQKEKGAQRKLICLIMQSNAVPRNGNRIMIDNIDIGHVTSGTYSPCLRKGIAMALVDSNAISDRHELSIIIRGKHEKAVIHTRPFHRYRGR